MKAHKKLIWWRKLVCHRCPEFSLIRQMQIAVIYWNADRGWPESECFIQPALIHIHRTFQQRRS